MTACFAAAGMLGGGLNLIMVGGSEVMSRPSLALTPEASKRLTDLFAQDAAAALECGGLARAVVADECADLARADVQAEILHGRLAAVGLGQMFDVEHKVPSFVRGSAPLCP